MNNPNNGSPRAPKQIQLVRNVIQLNPGFKLVYTTTQGAYVGTLVCDANTEDGLKLMAADLQGFIAEQTRGLQVVGGLAGLPPPANGR